MKTLGKIVIAAIVLGVAMCFMGCESPDETVSNGVDMVENEIDRIDGGGTTENKFSISSFGSPNVAGAAEDASVGISSLKINGQSGCLWKYSKGNISTAWGVAKDEIGIITVAGYQTAGGTWKCAKFDWCRPSNTTRDFKNINTKYNGWNPTEFYAAKKHCFFLMTKNGKKRTNIITD